MADDNSNYQGEITELRDPGKIATMVSNYQNRGQSRLEEILREAERLKTPRRGEGIDMERLMGQLKDADRLFGIVGRPLPRGYVLIKTTSLSGVMLKRDGRKADPGQLAADIGSGWIWELVQYFEAKVSPLRPKQIEGRSDDAE